MFSVNPSRFVVLTAAQDTNAKAGVAQHAREPDRAPNRPEATRPANAPSASAPPTLDDWEPSSRPDTLPGARSPKTPASKVQAPTGWRERLAGLLPGREQRFVRRVSRELLGLRRAVSASHARLRGRDLYREIVIARTHADTDSANTLLDHAEESYAMWPAPRALKFCDVVHFIAVSEFLATHDDTPWIHENVRREVESLIPDDL
jgi:hypothetical protein